MSEHATKRAILEVALDLLERSGPEAIGLRAVAERVGVTPMAIYRHVAGLPGLVAALVAHGQETLLGALQHAAGARTPSARLTATVLAYRDFALAHPRLYALVFAHAGDDDWRDASTVRFFVDRLRDAAEDDVARDLEAAAMSLWGQAHGLLSLQLAGKLGLDEASFRARYATSMTMVLAACGFTLAPGIQRRQKRR